MSQKCGHLIICRKALLQNIGPGRLSLVRYVAPGQISTGVDVESDRIQYIYVSPVTGGGFFLDSTLTSLNNEECRLEIKNILIPLLEEYLSQDYQLPQIIMIIDEKMLR